MRGQHPAERDSMRSIMQRVRERTPHHPGAADHAIEPRVLNHLQDRCDASSWFAQRPRHRIVELHFRRRIRTVAELVFEPIDLDGVARSVGEKARQQKTRQAFRGLRKNKMSIALRRREEPFVASQPPRAIAVRLGTGEIRANVRAALPFGHPHADQHCALRRDRERSRIVIADH